MMSRPLRRVTPRPARATATTPRAAYQIAVRSAAAWPRLRLRRKRTVLIAVTVLMTVEVASLAVLDRPFSPIARIQPSAMTNAIALLEAGRPGGPTQHDCGLSETTSSYRVRIAPPVVHARLG
jgi:hypothetical protein